MRQMALNIRLRGLDPVPAITAAAERYGIPPELAIEVARSESSLNPYVRDGGAGEIGMFQLMPATAAGLGVSNPRDPLQNIDGGVRLLAYLQQKYAGDTIKVLQAYNGGEGNVDRGTVSAAARNYSARTAARIGDFPDPASPALAIAWPPLPGLSPVDGNFPTLELGVGVLLAGIVGLLASRS